MPYYHVYINYKKEGADKEYSRKDINFSIKALTKLVNKCNNGKPFLLKGMNINPLNISKIEIWETQKKYNLMTLGRLQ